MSEFMIMSVLKNGMFTGAMIAAQYSLFLL